MHYIELFIFSLYALCFFLFDPDGVVDSLVRLVLQMYDPDGVTIEYEKENESATVSSLSLKCESSAIFTLAACPDTSVPAFTLFKTPSGSNHCC
jgi:hypothetical protein